MRARTRRFNSADVLVVGAGAAGLMAAQTLARAGKTVIIIEARDRIGGRIHTIHDPAFELPLDLGAEFVHGRAEPTWSLIRQAMLAPYDVGEEHWRRNSRGRLVKLDDLGDDMGQVMRRLRKIGREDMSFADFLDRYCKGATFRESRRMAIAFVEGFDAADITKISAKSLAEEQEGIGDVGEDGQEQFRLVSGYGALIDHLTASIKSQFSRIELRTRATSVHWSRGRVEIVARRGARQFKYTGQRAIITLPIGVLHSARLIEFDPELPRIRAAARQLGAGPVVKVILRFRDPFWENQKRGGKSLRIVSFLHNPGADIPTWWTTAPLRTSMLTGWAGGSAAERLSGKSHATIARTALDALGGMLNLKRSRLRALLLAAHVADWLSDPFARGAYSYVMVNGQQARRILATPVDDTLWFAGEAADTGDQASTVAGALASGERAARSILRA